MNTVTTMADMILYHIAQETPHILEIVEYIHVGLEIIETLF